MFEYTLLDRARGGRAAHRAAGGHRRARAARGRDPAAPARRRADAARRRGDGARRGVAGSALDLYGAHVLDPSEPELLERFAARVRGAPRAQGRDRRPGARRRLDVVLLRHDDGRARDGRRDGLAAPRTRRRRRSGRRSSWSRRARASRSSPASSSCASPTACSSTATARSTRTPTAAQLADIAISSAATAAQFGIEPRVAMLSYSTGASGSGAEVERVREATELVRERAPRAVRRGPDPVRRGGRRRRGAHQAAGQRGRRARDGLHLPGPQHRQQHLQGGPALAPNAVAIGPVLQGLSQPVNDLSRGATVHDIVNTVAITAIQGRERLRRQLRLVVAEVVGGRRRLGVDARVGHGRRTVERPHGGAVASVLEVGAAGRLEAVAHRVVHGGERFSAPVLIDDAVVAAIRDLAVLAPLHNPANADGIEVARRAFPAVPHVAVFDTAFHATLAAARVHVRRPARVGRAPLRLPRDLARVRVTRGGARAGPQRRRT